VDDFVQDMTTNYIGHHPKYVCIHRGKQIRTETCDCLGKYQFPVYECPIHTECADKRLRAGQTAVSCETCDDYQRK